jgi:hypothetical protein
MSICMGSRAGALQMRLCRSECAADVGPPQWLVVICHDCLRAASPWLCSTALRLQQAQDNANLYVHACSRTSLAGT